MTSGPRFTAADLARFCSVDLKTIHNWVAKGKLPDARTEGRHLRFRRVEIVEFLRAYHYPVPPSLRATRARIVAFDGDSTTLSVARRALGRHFEVTTYTDAVDALVAVGASDPDALVIGTTLAGFDVAHAITRLRATSETSHLRVVIFSADEARSAALRAAGASAFVPRAQPAKLREALAALTGVTP